MASLPAQGLRGFKRGHIDHEAIFDIARFHALVSIINVLNIQHFHITADVVLGAELQHLLGRGHAADQ